MSAIEYGSYYWCVLLNGKDGDKLGDSVHLHADDMAVDETGNLIFKSAGRRPAGTEPKLENRDETGEIDKPGEKAEKKENQEMIYVAIASGSWKMAYAAKLQDGLPASVEHWNDPQGHDAVVPPAAPLNAGARGYPPQA
jgi:hypothetical protein